VLPDYEAYLDSVEARWTADSKRFVKLDKGVQIGEHTIDLFGYNNFMSLTVMNFDALFAVMHSETPDAESISIYSSALADYSSMYHEHRSNDVWVYPVVVSQSFSQEQKSFVQSFDGKSKTKAWSRELREHPVLAELGTKSIYHYEKLSGILWRNTQTRRDFATKHFAFA
jgi:hypothetical protein